MREKFIFTGRQSSFGEQEWRAVGMGLPAYRENWVRIWGSVWFSSD